jgi:hypothetical protein
MRGAVTIVSGVLLGMLFQTFESALYARELNLDTFIKKVNVPKTDFFNAGFIDLISSGQVSASARLIRLMVGEPGKFSIPLTVYGGVSNTAFQQQAVFSLNRSNEHLVTQFITPLSGLLNLSVDGMPVLSKVSRITKWGLLYQVGERMLTGYRINSGANPFSGRSHNFLNSYAVGGVFFQTGAWERESSAQMGISWLSLRYHLCYTDPAQLNIFLDGVRTNGLYSGFSLGFGVEISYLVNIKAIYYRYTKAPEPAYSLPLYQFSFNYALQGKN